MAELESRLSLSPFLSVSSSRSLSVSYTLCCLSVIFFFSSSCLPLFPHYGCWVLSQRWPAGQGLRPCWSALEQNTEENGQRTFFGNGKLYYITINWVGGSNFCFTSAMCINLNVICIHLDASLRANSICSKTGGIYLIQIVVDGLQRISALLVDDCVLGQTDIALKS